jgi:hypothetical protein
MPVYTFSYALRVLVAPYLLESDELSCFIKAQFFDGPVLERNTAWRPWDYQQLL